jgi:hypothetical protein
VVMTPRVLKRSASSKWTEMIFETPGSSMVTP